MGVYYPQVAVTLRITWEDFGDKNNPKYKQVDAFSALARRVRVNINDYTQADTFDLEIDYKNFPFDPRTIRSCGVTIHMENMKRQVDENGKEVRIKPRTSNTIFTGFADEESITFDDTRRVVRLEGRDFTSLLIDRPYLKGTFPLDQPLDKVIQGLLSELQETLKLRLDVRVDGELPIISSYWPDKGDLSGKGNSLKKQSYWDVIQNIVSRAGLIAYVELDKLVISKPRVLYSRAQTVKFVYGKNLSSLEFKRKLGRKKNFNVAVTSTNLKTKEVLKALIPKEATPEWSEATGIAAIEVKTPEVDKDGNPLPEEQLKAAPYITFRVPDVANKDQLIRIGQEIFEEVGRQQIEGSFETLDMMTTGSWGGSYDVLKLRNGSPVSVDIEQGDLKGALRTSEGEAREKYLINRGYSRRVAAVLAEQIGRLSTPFYTKAVTYTMDSEQGFTCKVDFINFIEIDKTLGRN